MNSTEIVIQYITNLLQSGIIIFVACFVIGKIIKMSFMKFIPNDYIPAICAIIGGILGPTTGCFYKDLIIVQIIKGMIVGFAATGLYEFVRNTKGKSDSKSQ
jgi:hypothetical protein